MKPYGFIVYEYPGDPECDRTVAFRNRTEMETAVENAVVDGFGTDGLLLYVWDEAGCDRLVNIVYEMTLEYPRIVMLDEETCASVNRYAVSYA